MANPIYGQNKFDADANVSSKYLDFLAGYQGNLTAKGVDVTHAIALAAELSSPPVLAEVDAATYVANAVNECSATAAAACSIGYLPPAKKGTHLALNISGTLDEANACTIHCNNALGTVQPTGQRFAKQVIGVEGVTATSVVTAGTASAPTSENLIYTPAATNPKYGPGTQVHFYAVSEGEWLVKFFPVQLGTGAVGVLTVS